MSAESADSKRNVIALDLHSLLEEKTTLTHPYFFSSYNEDFWQPTHEWLTRRNPKTQQSGYQSEHITVRSYLMFCHLNDLASTFSMKESFDSYNSRRQLHDENKIIILCQELPRVFFKQAIATFKKHFKQWRSKLLLRLALAGENEVGCAIGRKLLGRSTQNDSFDSAVHHAMTHLLSLVDFLFDEVDVKSMTSQNFFVIFEDSIERISRGESI